MYTGDWNWILVREFAHVDRFAEYRVDNQDKTMNDQ
jgi:hypothetical protein